MTNDERYTQFCHENRNLDTNEFFDKLMLEFGVSQGTASDMWYAVQRSWYRPEMMDELIRLDGSKDEFKPNLCSGEFHWDRENKRFMPMSEQA